MEPLSRRSLLGLLASAALVRCARPEAEPRAVDPAQAALDRGAAWLWAQQEPRGAFPSQTYGLLRRGQSLTPFCLLALADAADAGAPFQTEAAGRALGAILSFAAEDGAIGFVDPVVDYPVYASALSLSAFARLGPTGWRERLAPTERWLRAAQLRRDAGWAGHPGQGGFPMGGRAPPAPPEAGHVDLSMSRRALEALAAWGAGPEDPAMVEGREFVLRCQAPDGGFIYSPVEGALNKGARTTEEPVVYQGYGSATTDGILALLAVGVPPSDRALERALEALGAAHRVDLNPGVEAGPSAAFASAMRYYYRAGSAAVFRALGGPPGWREALCAALVAEQRADGAWANPVALQKEDDPIIATGFALRALAAARMQPSR